MRLDGIDRTNPGALDVGVFTPEGTLVPAAGERILWQGLVGAVRFCESIQGTDYASTAKNLQWRLERDVHVALTDSRTVCWTNELGPGLGTSLNAGWVVAGPVGMLAHNLVKKHAARNLVAAGQVQHREILQVCLIPDGAGVWVRLVTWPYAKEQDLNAVDIFLSEAGAREFAIDLTRTAAADRIPRIADLRARYPWQAHMLEHQARTPRSPRSNDIYPLAMYFAGANSKTPFTAVQDAERMADWEARGLAEMHALEERIASSEDGVRSSDPQRQDVVLGGYRFVLPTWWDDIHPAMPPEDIDTFAKTVNWIIATYGAIMGGEDHWQEALKIAFMRVGPTNPTIFGAAYRGAKRLEQAAVAAMDAADFFRHVEPGHPLFFGAPQYEGVACLQAGMSCSELHLEAATQYWLRRCVNTGSGDIADKASEMLKSMSTA